MRLLERSPANQRASIFSSSVENRLEGKVAIPPSSASSAAAGDPLHFFGNPIHDGFLTFDSITNDDLQSPSTPSSLYNNNNNNNNIDGPATATTPVTSAENRDSSGVSAANGDGLGPNISVDSVDN
ncbi:hypothetical protein V9T40_001050 [Parthenolecanium corni]|uniref:Uncharacterized protein n=1 Tax=Parthenolecanium corni TaxID=536013 RepID=A0AAN9Y105_9HEMI